MFLLGLVVLQHLFMWVLRRWLDSDTEDSNTEAPDVGVYTGDANTREVDDTADDESTVHNSWVRRRRV